MSRNEIDRLVNKWISRKLLVFIIATIALFTKFITSSDWLIVSSIYLGTETTINIIAQYLKARTT